MLEKLLTVMKPYWESSTASYPLRLRIALRATSHGTSLMLALTVPLTLGDDRIERPLYSLKIFSTSTIGRSSKLMVSRRCWDCTCLRARRFPLTHIAAVSAAPDIGTAAFAGALALAEYFGGAGRAGSTFRR